MAIVVKSDEADAPRWTLDEKRFYMPGFVIVDDCVYCGHEMRLDLSNSYFSYPGVNAVQEEWFPECYECGCECYARDDYKQQTFKFILSIDLKIVDD